MSNHYEIQDRVRNLEQRAPVLQGLEDFPNHRNFDVQFFTSREILQTVRDTGAMVVTYYPSHGSATGMRPFSVKRTRSLVIGLNDRQPFVTGDKTLGNPS